MIFFVRYKDKNIFDIELYWSSEFDEPELELHVTTIPETLIDYVMKVLKYSSENTIEQFKKDCHDITELRGWLWEQFKIKTPKNREERYDSEQYNKAAEYIETLLEVFKKRYPSLKIVKD